MASSSLSLVSLYAVYVCTHFESRLRIFLEPFFFLLSLLLQILFVVRRHLAAYAVFSHYGVEESRCVV